MITICLVERLRSVCVQLFTFCMVLLLVVYGLLSEYRALVQIAYLVTVGGSSIVEWCDVSVIFVTLYIQQSIMYIFVESHNILDFGVEFCDVSSAS